MLHVIVVGTAPAGNQVPRCPRFVVVHWGMVAKDDDWPLKALNFGGKEFLLSARIQAICIKSNQLYADSAVLQGFRVVRPALQQWSEIIIFGLFQIVFAECFGAGRAALVLFGAQFVKGFLQMTFKLPELVGTYRVALGDAMFPFLQECLAFFCRRVD